MNAFETLPVPNRSIWSLGWTVNFEPVLRCQHTLSATPNRQPKPELWVEIAFDRSEFSNPIFRRRLVLADGQWADDRLVWDLSPQGGLSSRNSSTLGGAWDAFEIRAYDAIIRSAPLAKPRSWRDTSRLAISARPAGPKGVHGGRGRDGWPDLGRPRAGCGLTSKSARWPGKATIDGRLCRKRCTHAHES
jgi:hypothetical protein